MNKQSSFADLKILPIGIGTFYIPCNYMNVADKSSIMSITKPHSEKMYLMFMSVRIILSLLVYTWDGGKYTKNAFNITFILFK